jgi:hypothetical protein
MEVLTDKRVLTNKNNNGVQGAPTLEVTEYGDGVQHVTKIKLTNYVVGPLAGAAAAKVLVPPTALYTLPAGSQVLEVTRMKVGLSCAGTAVTPDLGLGSVIGDGSANADLGTAGATQEDIHTGYAVADTVTGAEVESGPKGVTAGILTGIALNKTGDAKTIYLNVAALWNADNVGNLLANGEITIVWKTTS